MSDERQLMSEGAPSVICHLISVICYLMHSIATKSTQPRV